MRRDPCAACGLPVFLAEKLVVAHAAYHRTCFRCARCSNQLTPGNYYETEEGQYCCETCPDEEERRSPRTSMHQAYNEAVIDGISPRRTRTGGQELAARQRSLSDEEKTGRKVLEDYEGTTRRSEEPTIPDLIAQTSQMRLSFMASHLLSERNEGGCAVEGTGNEDGGWQERRTGSAERVETVREPAAFPDEEEEEEEEEEEDETGSSVEFSIRGEATVKAVRGDLDVVHSALEDSLARKEDEEQRLTAISFHDVVRDKPVSVVGKEEDTKELLSRPNGRGEADGEGLSLVQKRLKMFETKERKEPEKRNRLARLTPEPLEPRILVKEGIGVENRAHDPEVLEGGDKETSSRIEEGIESKGSPSMMARTKIDAKSGSRVFDVDSTSRSEAISGARGNGAARDKEARLQDTNATVTSSGKPADRAQQRIEVDSSDASTNLEKGQPSQESIIESSLTAMEGIDLSEDYPEDLNPFKSDEENDVAGANRSTTALDCSRSSKVSTNPFESDEEEEDADRPNEVVPPKPAVRCTVLDKAKQQAVVEVPTKRRLVAPHINLNPFWSDDEEDQDSDLDGKERKTPGKVPVPKPRTIKRTPELGVAQRKSDLNRGGLYASNSSITSSESTSTPGGTYRKKKPAPQPPAAKELFPTDQRTPPMVKSHNGPSTGYNSTSPRTTPRARKTKPAPPPPMPTSTPLNLPVVAPLNFGESPIIENPTRNDDQDSNVWEDQKTNKDEANRNRQSLTSVSGESLSYKSYPDKSVQGKWKRKKGPAPPRPIPHRRKIKVMSMKDVKLELDEIELQQQGLERQGVRLEQLIRDKCESGPKIDEVSIGIDVEELVLELFALVNEKNELFRRQAELMLLRRQQRLEEEHAEVEYQIRCLMCQPEATKTDFDKQREETLIQRLIEIVERRNEIVECLEMDRRREVEEDRSIHKHMGLFAARNKNEISTNNNDSCHSSKAKKGKTKEKTKEKKSKKTSKKDADKDVDETEVKLKRHHKRKWF
ncbi:hypothetical protein KM043_015270 [Ampulex compressa]|nr:hypothetical protein KM043_015270 [Ampulex compressa]